MNHYEELILVKPAKEFESGYVAMVCEFLHTDEAWFNNFELALALHMKFGLHTKLGACT